MTAVLVPWNWPGRWWWWYQLMKLKQYRRSDDGQYSGVGDTCSSMTWRWLVNYKTAVKWWKAGNEVIWYSWWPWWYDPTMTSDYRWSEYRQNRKSRSGWLPKNEELPMLTADENGSGGNLKPVIFSDLTMTEKPAGKQKRQTVFCIRRDIRRWLKLLIFSVTMGDCSWKYSNGRTTVREGRTLMMPVLKKAMKLWLWQTRPMLMKKTDRGGGLAKQWAGDAGVGDRAEEGADGYWAMNLEKVFLNDKWLWRRLKRPGVVTVCDKMCGKLLFVKLMTVLLKARTVHASSTK